MNTDTFRISKKIKNVLTKHQTILSKNNKNEDQLKEDLQKTQSELAEYQQLLYAQNQWSVLVILQGMDTAGKDGLIEHVMESMNPQSCSVTSFKKPTHLELNHDFLWRTHNALPVRGTVGVFNRSYYEDIIVPFVHPEILNQSQLPKEILKSKDLLLNRCKDIVNFENYLIRQGTIVIKLFLNISKKEQKNRLVRRLELPEKNWKFDPSDIIERQYWNQYQKAYNFCFENTSHSCAPWYIIPSDNKQVARVIASQIITNQIAKLNLNFPEVDAKRKRLLTKYHKQLIAE